MEILFFLVEIALFDESGKLKVYVRNGHCSPALCRGSRLDNDQPTLFKSFVVVIKRDGSTRPPLFYPGEVRYAFTNSANMACIYRSINGRKLG